MGKTIRAQRNGKSTVYMAHTTKRIAPAKFKNMDYVERNGYIRGVVRDVVHDSGRGAALAKVKFRDPTRFQKMSNTLLPQKECTLDNTYILGPKPH